MNTSRPKVRRSRALGIPLTPKCVAYFEKRPYPPGEHGRKRRTASDYSTRLMEKQRLRAQYDISETQLRRAFDRARRSGGKTGEALVQDLEARLDATVLRAGFARTIYQARQTVTHQHVTVNGRRVDRPSYRLVPGDVVAIADRSRRKEPFLVAASGAHAAAPSYLTVSLADLVCRVDRVPAREEVPVVCQEQLVVEHYSR
ncbi:30S ribosomal protein S4 [Modestobacter sp. I12A-02628]|uniref:Small ribosomal subunit protein uS4 n=1 Tax=Goekera deserti TaxID=2497753 RepID=A0A7K3WGQ6_9ACTN|nr:30S ribosomal protein S4 [Goekera deserti]NDI46375.1 30S ribosomal protein S4 [Goekera deserti]NEL54693.1 30S ribosomal protein S4 [Goekera deserti]